MKLRQTASHAPRTDSETKPRHANDIERSQNGQRHEGSANNVARSQNGQRGEVSSIAVDKLEQASIDDAHSQNGQ